jgi:hypothetical protein
VQKLTIVVNIKTKREYFCFHNRYLLNKLSFKSYILKNVILKLVIMALLLLKQRCYLILYYLKTVLNLQVVTSIYRVRYKYPSFVLLVTPPVPSIEV